MTKFTVAICGGGVGGLACAVALSQYPDIRIDVYEAASKFLKSVVQALGWTGSSQRLPSSPLIIIQVGKANCFISTRGTTAPTYVIELSFNFRKGDQSEGYTFHQLYTPAILLRHLSASSRTYTSKRSSHSPIALRFKDGSTATCDVLIGADGVKSATRRRSSTSLRTPRSLRRAAQPRWSGIYAYRTTIPAEALRSRIPNHTVLREPMAYLGKDTQVTAYPLLHGKIINVAAFRTRYDSEGAPMKEPWVVDTTKDELAADFAGWEPEVQAMFQCTSKLSRWAIHTTERLPTFVSGRVALVGDSAHAAVPFQGAGAGQAIEDAYLLATLLGHPKTTLSTLTRALRIYDAVRRPYAQDVAKTSRECGMLFTLNYPGLSSQDIANGQAADKLRVIAETIRKKWSWAWDTTLDGDIQRAVRELEAS
ncbi:uncharacterized protein B0H18DRAFT_1084856 [Fomitopsis serialis]|uniref:uncharacterized protein n=1 Tax=Fomitopsis serialis TaxID=139415 RepID=UPI0020085695|nr:uncharacterized protein B0H18DRAFT_1084856 [Neoantrodia serialis]KAH9926901.1 hypothetical protein B0H18DRAFT_1084856 [Neoantrodia serialis]